MKLLIELTSGSRLAISEVRLYSKRELSHVLAARAAALSQIQGSGLGFFGRPDLVIAASMILAWAESAATRNGAEALRKAEAALASVRQGDRQFFPVGDIVNIGFPNPDLWQAGNVKGSIVEIPASSFSGTRDSLIYLVAGAPSR